MKLFVVLLGLLAIASATRLKKSTEKTSQEWADVDKSQWQSGDVGDSLTWGIQHTLEAAAREGKINNTNFVITQINRVQQQVVGRAVNYKYDVVLSNYEGSTFTTTFTVNFVTFSGLRTLTHYNYTVRTVYTISQPEPSATGDWQEIDLSELHTNDDLADSMEWAISTIYNDGVAAGKIKDDNYKIVDTALWEQPMTEGNSYRGQIELNNGKTISVYISFIVYLSPEGKRTLTLSHYKVIGSIPAPARTHSHSHRI